jgi:hypothetical protein
MREIEKIDKQMEALFSEKRGSETKSGLLSRL